MNDVKHAPLAHVICFGPNAFAFQFLDPHSEPMQQHAGQVLEALVALTRATARVVGDPREDFQAHEGLLRGCELLAGLAAAMHAEFNREGGAA